MVPTVRKLVMRKFVWMEIGQTCEVVGETGYMFRDTTQEDGDCPRLSSEEVVGLFLNEEGRCFAGDDLFNATVEAAARSLGQGRAGPDLEK